MNNSINTPWHKESYDKFIDQTLPALLAQRLPITGYASANQDVYTRKLTVSVADVQVEYELLQPDEDGLFEIDGRPYIVVPAASSAHLDKAEISCVGEQMLEYVASHLGESTSELPWDESLVRAWLPLDTWVREVITSRTDGAFSYGYTGQLLDTTNTIAALTHRRRILVPDPEDVITPGQFGRVCPFEVPEGPNIGRVFSLAVGAVIRNGSMQVIDERPEATLGLTASMIPFLEQNDPNRLTLGVNMMRQWMVSTSPETAFVQTGNEPDEPGVWCGKNLLTAYISWGAETFEDGIVISQSCADRLSFGYDKPVQVGDKISNRHGTKGVISRILPDNEMPHLGDGTPIELIYSFLGIHARQNFGQIREAAVSRVANINGEPIISAPFKSIGDEELRKALTDAQLSADGMETLTIGRNGKPLERPSMVGWVYWGRTVHTASGKIHACVSGSKCNLAGELEYYALRDMECFATIQSIFGTCCNNRDDRDDFIRDIESGQPIEQSNYLSPQFARFRRRLSDVGIQTELTSSGLTFSLGQPKGETLQLAASVPHPWLPSYELTEISAIPEIAEYRLLAEANSALRRALENNVPESLRQKAYADLSDRLGALFAKLVKGADDDPVNAYFLSKSAEIDMKPRSEVMFSGRAVLAPGFDIHLDEVDLADEIAWTIFEPLLIRALGDKKAVKERRDAAAQALDDIMSRSWVIVDHAPVLINTALMAFRPKRIPEPVIRLHPLACFLMNADFDGDQAAVFLPITEDAQREAAQKLSLAGHLTLDSNLYGLRLLTHEAIWGLAYLSLKPDGLNEIKALANVDLPLAAPLDRESAAEIIRHCLNQKGAVAAVQLLEELYELGIRVARESGASMSTFFGSTIERPAVPSGDDPGDWANYYEEVLDRLESCTDYLSSDIGPQLLAVKSGARGAMRSLVRLSGPSFTVKNTENRDIPIRYGFRQGLTPSEMFACVAGARRGLANISNEIIAGGYGVRGSHGPKGFGVIARAMRASNPGRVFARAAAAGECDPLTDLDSRLFVGLPPLE